MRRAEASMFQGTAAPVRTVAGAERRVKRRCWSVHIFGVMMSGSAMAARVLSVTVA
jgi:hypothetical protein